MSCHEYEPLIERMLADEIGTGERDRLLSHTEGCAECREFVDLHYRLMEPDPTAELPTNEEFAEMRRSVIRDLRVEPSRSSNRFWSGLADLFNLFAVRPALAGGLAALMLVILSAGVLVGRGTSDGAFSFDSAVDPTGDGLVSQIGRAALANDKLVDVAESPFLYSNVRFEELPDGVLAMNFDVTRRLEVKRDRDDPLVRDVLAQSLLNQEPLATRLDAVGYAGRISDPVIEQALIHTMLNDPDLAVRVKALKILSAYAPNDDIEAAFVMVLSGEEAVQLRMLALDYLAASQSVSPERLDDVMRNLQGTDNRALMVRYSDDIN